MVKDLLKGDVKTLAKAITLIESQNPEHETKALNLLKDILPFTGKSFRLAISGPPGVGKSTFIDGFGSYLVKKYNKKVAVLSIDPSSPLAGGSLLADKTRMFELSQLKDAFIRPSPTSGALGGVNLKTRESLLLCEAAGFDFVIIETVGVGQSEITAANMVDCFITLLMPNSGDELQGIKKGILEISQIMIVNKWDGEFKDSASKTANQLKSAISIVGENGTWAPSILLCSSLEKMGFEDIYNELIKFKQTQDKTGHWELTRRQQNIKWFEQNIDQKIKRWIDKKLKGQLGELTTLVSENKISVPDAVDKLFNQLKLF